MRLTAPQLEAGLLTLARVLHEDEWANYDYFQRHSLRHQLKAWLAPCLLTLPLDATADAIRADDYYDLFVECAGDFLLAKLRKNQLFDHYTDRELKSRLSGEEIEEAASYLSSMAAILLKGAEAGEKAYISVMANGFAEDALPAIQGDWDNALTDLLGIGPDKR